MAREVKIGKRRFWIISEPEKSEKAGWKAHVVEVMDAAGKITRELGIEAYGETRGIADEAAHGKLHLLLAGSGGGRTRPGRE